MIFTTHAFDHMDEFDQTFDGRWNSSPHAIGCKDLKWTKRACIEKNNEICQKREIDEMKTFESYWNTNDYTTWM